MQIDVLIDNAGVLIINIFLMKRNTSLTQKYNLPYEIHVSYQTTCGNYSVLYKRYVSYKACLIF